jgi:SNF2 family DNA or RNA helicase
LRAHEQTRSERRGRRKRESDVPAIDLYAGWEWLSDRYEAAIARYAAAMPRVCAACAANLQGDDLFARESLLRHCAENLLYQIVVGTPFTAQLDQQTAGTLLHRCLHPSAQTETTRTPYWLGVATQAYQPTLDDYTRWRAWRQKLVSTRAASGFALCFRLEEAPPGDGDNWQVHLLVSPAHDPSLKLALADYWPLNAAAKAAIRRQFGEDFEKQVLLALGTAARIYPKVWDGLETDRPSGFRLSLDEAFAFLQESAWVLEDAGFTVIVPAWWTPEGRRRAKIRLKTTARSANGGTSVTSGLLGLDSLIRYQYELAIDGRPITESEWRELVEAKTPLVRFRGQWMELDREKMQQMLAFWRARSVDMPEMSLQDMLRIATEAGSDLEWEHDDAVSAMLTRLNDKSAFAPVEDPEDLHGVLRDYQRRGVAWLQYLETLGLNPCLADDMGLGKTVQVIARLLQERTEGSDLAPTLLIAPTSVLGNWRREIERFAPRLRTLVHQGAAREKNAEAFQAACRSADVVLTSFTLARMDESLLRGVAWRRVVVDEAQNIKNPQSAQTRAVLKLKASHRVALTGTPVENRLRDLWSIFNFLNPGYLGKEAQFRQGFELPIQKNGDEVRSMTLKKLVEPFILRRLKTDKRIIEDLPEKVEQKLYCTLTPEQASLYEAVVKDISTRIDDVEGMERRGLVLATLMRLKQICNHPAQFLQDGSFFGAERSHKLERLTEMMEEVIESGDSMLVFSQFTEVGAALERFVRQTRHYNTYYLHGGTSATRRDQMVAEFQDPETEPSVFILSLRAGGVGLNLTRASHVFHFDRWWNPAVEDQATDRAFRIGQQKSVFVHKFVAMGTVEEKIDALIEDKKRISASIVGADESWLTELDNDTFKQLIALQQSAVGE